MLRYRAAVLAIALAVAPSSLQGQAQFTISGFGGVYLPAADLISGVFPISGQEVAATFKQKTIVNFGGRIGVWPTRRLGFEAEVLYQLSKLNADLLIPAVRRPPPDIVLGLDQGSLEEDANVFMGSVNVVFALIRPPLEPLVVYISGGVGFISRGGDGFDAFDDTNDVAGVWGLGLKYGVARSLWLRADVRDYVSSFKEGDLDSKVQNDLTLNAGFELSVGG